jgi:hypothetical protein
MKTTSSLSVCLSLFAAISLAGSDGLALAEDAKSIDLSTWTRLPGQADVNGFTATVEGTTATLKDSGEWSYLRNNEQQGSTLLNATITIEKPATQFGFFGESWSVWPADCSAITVAFG